MELRGQDKEIGMPGSLGYNPPDREPSSKLSPPAPSPLASTTVGERRRDQTTHGNPIFSPPQTLDHYPSYHHHLQSNPQQQTHGLRKGPDPNPDPSPATIGATSTPIASTSNLRSPPPPPTSTITSATPPVRYRECLKNHAASMGGHVVDGCGEFMPSGEEGTPEALKCAACECHRNFHRKEMEGDVANCYYSYNNSNRNKGRRDTNPPPQHPQHPPPLLPPPQLHQHQRYSHGFSTSPSTGPIQPMMMAFGGSAGAPAESSSEDLNMFQSDVGGQTSVQPPLSKKRFRTKFSHEQKEGMMEFAEKLGWKIQKQDEQEVQRFCAEVGVKRQVFKVWMHNNKQAMKKKQM